MRVITGIVLSTLTYLLLSVLLVLLVHACVPGGVRPDGRPAAQASLILDLAVQGVACFAAGAVALAHAGGSIRLATGAMGGVILALVLASALSFWSLVPDWYNEALIAMTLPFVALGAAWRRATCDEAAAGTR
jgi:hypothetical protein